MLIGGFIAGGSGGGAANVLVRALGPSLAAAGISDALPNPTLELRNANGALLQSNDYWGSTGSTSYADIQATGLAPSDFREAPRVEQRKQFRNFIV